MLPIIYLFGCPRSGSHTTADFGKNSVEENKTTGEFPIKIKYNMDILFIIFIDISYLSYKCYIFIVFISIGNPPNIMFWGLIFFKHFCLGFCENIYDNICTILYNATLAKLHGLLWATFHLLLMAQYVFYESHNNSYLIFRIYEV